MKAAREIHAGSGYWSQDSAVLVFPPSPTVSEVKIRWPGGKITIGKMIPGEPELVMKYSAPETK